MKRAKQPDIIKISVQERKIYLLEKQFNELYENGMSLSSREAVDLSEKINKEKTVLAELQKSAPH